MKRRAYISLIMLLMFVVASFAADFTKVYFKGYDLSSYQYPKKNSEGIYYPYYESVELVKNYGTISIDEISGTMQYKYISGETYTAKDIKKLIRFEFDPKLGSIESIVYLGKWDNNGVDFKLQFFKETTSQYSVKLYTKRNVDPSMLGGEYYNKEFHFHTLRITPNEL